MATAPTTPRPTAVSAAEKEAVLQAVREVRLMLQELCNILNRQPQNRGGGFGALDQLPSAEEIDLIPIQGRDPGSFVQKGEVDLQALERPLNLIRRLVQEPRFKNESLLHPQEVPFYNACRALFDAELGLRALHLYRDGNGNALTMVKRRAPRDTFARAAYLERLGVTDLERQELDGLRFVAWPE